MPCDLLPGVPGVSRLLLLACDSADLKGEVTASSFRYSGQHRQCRHLAAAFDQRNHRLSRVHSAGQSRLA